MAKKNQHIDDFFKDRLKGESLPLDGNEWGKVFDELHGKKKRRFFWLWLFLPLAIFAGWYLVQTSNEDAGDSQKSEIITQAEASIPDVQPKADNATSTGNAPIESEKGATDLDNDSDSEVIVEDIVSSSSSLVTPSVNDMTSSIQPDGTLSDDHDVNAVTSTGIDASPTDQNMPLHLSLGPSKS